MKYIIPKGHNGAHPKIFNNKIVDNHSISACAKAQSNAREINGEADLLGPGCASVGQSQDLPMQYKSARGEEISSVRGRTLSLTPSTLPQPLITNGSFAAMTAITSTPLALNSSYF